MRTTGRGWLGNSALGVWTGLVVLYLLLPLGVIVAFSLNDSDFPALPMRGLTLKWYWRFFESKELVTAVWNSVLVAVATTVLATVFGTMAAIGLSRSGPRMQRVLRPALSTPMMTPRLVVGIALLTLYNLISLDLSLWTVILGHTVVAIPYVILVITARLIGLDPRLEEAAYDLGATRVRVVIDILLPLLLPAIIGSALIAFTLSFDEVVITFFTTGTENTLPTTIWAMLRFGITPELNAVSTVMMFVTVAVALTAEVMIRRGRVSRTSKNATIALTHGHLSSRWRRRMGAWRKTLGQTSRFH
jgi:spermidine/putrescine transport system permease protein